MDDTPKLQKLIESSGFVVCFLWTKRGQWNNLPQWHLPVWTRTFLRHYNYNCIYHNTGNQKKAVQGQPEPQGGPIPRGHTGARPAGGAKSAEDPLPSPRPCLEDEDPRTGAIRHRHAWRLQVGMPKAQKVEQTRKDRRRRFMVTMDEERQDRLLNSGLRSLNLTQGTTTATTTSATCGSRVNSKAFNSTINNGWCSSELYPNTRPTACERDPGPIEETCPSAGANEEHLGSPRPNECVEQDEK
ncbi:MAG: hypothetical protein J3Q66DRAFT_368696 [Benniella sp.]|nr:MAG: hypothetical protein J3Q66DRAFT_368696 [Benniella sp.]